MSSNFTNTSTVTTAEAFKVDSRAGNKAPSNLVVGIDTTTKTNSVCAATQGGARSLGLAVRVSGGVNFAFRHSFSQLARSHENWAGLKQLPEVSPTRTHTQTYHNDQDDTIS